MQFPNVQQFSSAYPMEVGDRISTYRNWFRKRPTETMLKVISENYGSESKEVAQSFLDFEEGRNDAYQLLDSMIIIASWHTAGVLFLMELHGIGQLEDARYEELTAKIEDSQKTIVEKFLKIGKLWGFTPVSLPDNEGLELNLRTGAITML